MTDRYFLSAKLGSERVEREVTLQQYCEAERAAGYRPKLPSTDPRYLITPATSGFSGAISGRSERVDETAVPARPPQARGDGPRRASDAEIMEWVDRHDLRIGSVTDARCVFEDAESHYLTRGGSTPANHSGDATEMVMTVADKYWEASTAARYRVREELEQTVRSALATAAKR